MNPQEVVIVQFLPLLDQGYFFGAGFGLAFTFWVIRFMIRRARGAAQETDFR